MKNPFRRSERRSLPAPSNELPLYAGSGGFTDIRLTAMEALRIADVWSCVRLLSDVASSLPIHVFRKTDRGRERVESGRLVGLLESPSPTVTQPDFVATLVCHVLIHGSGFIGKFRDGGEVVSLSLLDPLRIRPELQGGQVRWRYSPPQGAQRLLTVADVCQVRSMSTDQLNGLSTVEMASEVLGLNRELVKNALDYFRTGRGRLTGVLKMPPDASEEARGRMREAVANEQKPHSVLIITGEGEFEQFEGRLDSAQFEQQRRLSTQEVCRAFRVPSHLLNAGSGGDSLTYSTSESMSADFVKYTLSPLLRKIEAAISNDPDLAFQKQYIKFSVDALLRASSKDRAEFYKIAADPIVGWMSRSEIRQLEDLEPEPPTTQPTVEQMLAAANGKKTEVGDALES